MIIQIPNSFKFLFLRSSIRKYCKPVILGCEVNFHKGSEESSYLIVLFVINFEMSELVETVLVEEEREEEGEEKEIQRAILSSSHDDELIQVLKRYRNWISVQKEVITVHLDEEFYHFLANRIRSSSNEQLQLEIAYWYALLIALPNFNGTFPAAVKHILEAAVASTENYEMVENTLDIILMTIGKNKNFNLYTGEIITILLNQGRSSQSSVIKGKILGIFSKLCWGYFQNAPDTLPFIFQCLNSSDSLLIARAAEALSAFTESSDHQIDEILSADSTLPNRLAELLLSPVEDVVHQAIRTVGNIITGNDLQTQTLINAGIIPNLLWLIDYPNKKISREACWTISNISAGTVTQIQEIINAAIIPRLLSYLPTIKEEEIQVDILFTIANVLCGGSESQKVYILNEGVAEKLSQLLSIMVESGDIQPKVCKPLYECFLSIVEFVRQYPDKSKEEHVREVYRTYDVVNKLKFGDNRIPSISHLDNFVNGI